MTLQQQHTHLIDYSASGSRSLMQRPARARDQTARLASLGQADSSPVGLLFLGALICACLALFSQGWVAWVFAGSTSLLLIALLLEKRRHDQQQIDFIPDPPPNAQNKPAEQTNEPQI
ncbi:hypothetical protein V6U78_09265 [Marinospirillum sp. MEB164]|uniref:Uncharacterized protein n=1 Tax=Marinospirillum alkalitolerans TaxID=3123374 RepID=A0ABW8Q020_9GAMM